MGNYITAAVRANLILNKYWIESPEELDLVGIINAEGIIINYSSLSGHLGRICHSDNSGLITISDSILDEGHRNFVLAHEFGHFITDSTRKTTCNETDLIKFRSNRDAESRANNFAAELLMNRKWFTGFTGNSVISTSLLEETSVHFRTSLSSTAIRYTEIGYFPCAMIMSKKGFTCWTAIHKEFPYKFIPSGVRVNPNSYVYDYFKSGNKIGGPKEVPIDAWFGDDRNYKNGIALIEENIYMENYGAVLSIVRQA